MTKRKTKPADTDTDAAELAELEDLVRNSTAAAVWHDATRLRPWADNPVAHPDEQLLEILQSIRDHGWGRTVVAHWPSRRIIAGHGAVAAFLQLRDRHPEFVLPDAPGAPEPGHGGGLIPVRFLAGPWEQYEALAIADNKVADLRQWKHDRLHEVLERIGERRRAKLPGTFTGWRPGELASRVQEHLRNRPSPKPPAPDPEHVTAPPPVQPPPPADADSKVGTTYELGPHRLWVGEWKGDRHPSLLEGEQADAGVTDPPYAIYGSSSGVGSDVADSAMVRPFFRMVWVGLQLSLRAFAHAYLCCDWRSYPVIVLSADGCNFDQSNLIVWDKVRAGLGSNRQNQHELVAFATLLPVRTTMRSTEQVGRRTVLGRSNVIRAEGTTDDGLPVLTPQDLQDLHHLIGKLGEDRARPELAATVQLLAESMDDHELLMPMRRGPEGGLLQHRPVSSRDKLHNAEKPQGLLEDLITGGTDPGQLVLDPFGGSGSSLITCARLGRVWRGGEQHPGQADAIRRRWTAWAREAGQDPGPGALE